jgi:hypothetical protein
VMHKVAYWLATMDLRFRQPQQQLGEIDRHPPRLVLVSRFVADRRCGSSSKRLLGQRRCNPAGRFYFDTLAFRLTIVRLFHKTRIGRIRR